jgi:hypothetical protein
MQVQRFAENPIVRPNMDARMGDNINGPSLIRVPDWVANPLGRYYLYFAHHDGRYIRLAFADDLHGPWGMHEPGVLPLEQSLFAGHIASPDVQIDEQRRQIRLYYHGAERPTGGGQPQQTRLALSSDGLQFKAQPEELGLPYFRLFRWRDTWYAVAMPGVLYRSADGLTGFERGPTLPLPNIRHCALKVVGDRLEFFYTQIGDCPEGVLLATIDLTPDWSAWQPSPPVVVLEPELPYEGADQPRVPSARGLIHGPVHQLRDPDIFEEDGRTYLVYTVAGEYGLALAELID